jgi:hypothetical protein
LSGRLRRYCLCIASRRRNRRRSSQDERLHDSPVRDLSENIAELERDPRAQQLTREQLVASAYTAVYARVLREQSEEYDELLALVRPEGDTSEVLRGLAMGCARTIAELNLSARLEEVDILEHAIGGMDASAAIVFLDLIKSCLVLIAGDGLDRDLLLRRDELDALLNAPSMIEWWKLALPSDGPPPLFGTSRLRRPWHPGKVVRCVSLMPADLALAEGTVQAVAERLDDAVERYRAVLGAHVRGTDRWVPRKAFALAHELTAMQFGTWGRVDFGVLEPQLIPVAAQAVLHLVVDSCLVLADPDGDFERYGIPLDQIDRRLAEPELRAWRAAVAALG